MCGAFFEFSTDVQLTDSFNSQYELSTVCYNVYIIDRTWAEIRYLFRVLNMISHEWAQRTSEKYDVQHEKYVWYCQALGYFSLI